MSAPILEGRKVLLVEDRYLIAMEMEVQIQQLGGSVVGPARDIEQANALLREGAVDLALLDINLEGELVYPLAERLLEEDVPFIFLTGYDDWVLPEAWAETPQLRKPVTGAALAEEIAKLPPRH